MSGGFDWAGYKPAAQPAQFNFGSFNPSSFGSFNPSSLNFGKDTDLSERFKMYALPAGSSEAAAAEERRREAVARAKRGSIMQGGKDDGDDPFEEYKADEVKAEVEGWTDVPQPPKPLFEFARTTYSSDSAAASRPKKLSNPLLAAAKPRRAPQAFNMSALSVDLPLTFAASSESTGGAKRRRSKPRRRVGTLSHKRKAARRKTPGSRKRGASRRRR